MYNTSRRRRRSMSSLFGLGPPGSKPCVGRRRPLTLVASTPPVPYWADKLVVYVVESPPWTALQTNIPPPQIGAPPDAAITSGMPWLTSLCSPDAPFASSTSVPQYIQNTYFDAVRVRAMHFFTFSGTPATDGVASATIYAKAACRAAGASNASLTFCYAWCAQPAEPGCVPVNPCGGGQLQTFRVTGKTHCGMSFRMLEQVQTDPSGSGPNYVVLELAQDCSAPGTDVVTNVTSACASGGDAINPCLSGTTYTKFFQTGTNQIRYESEVQG